MDYIIKYINDNISERLTLKSVAQYAGYSTWHFCEKFKAYTGTTFIEYLRSRRMQAAVNALLRGYRITDIAMDYGYESVNGFEKAFLKKFGCSPRDYLDDANYYQEKYEKRRSEMFRLTDRCHILRENIISQQYKEDSIIGQYSYHYWKGFLSIPKEKRNNCSVSAAGLRSMIQNHLPVVFEGELIVGYNYGNDALLHNERELLRTIQADPKKARRYLSRGKLSNEQIDELFGFAADPECRWPYKQVQFEVEPDKHERELIEEMAAMGYCCVDTHSILGYDRVLQFGFRGILHQIQTDREKKGSLTPVQKAFYDGAEKVCEACCQLGKRYEDAVGLLIDTCDDPQRKAELLEMQAVCANVPENPASGFWEAVQSLWFAHIVNTWEDGVNANSFGRLDQILYPYYQKDIESGKITKEFAFELLCCLWLKLYRDYDVQQSTVGGCGRDGNCAVNDLSYMMLDATEMLDFVRCLSVRYSQNTPKAFLRRAFEVVRHVQKGIPFFFNDDVIIEALCRRGITREDAREYAMIGCVETCIPGKANPHAVSARCNVLKALEYALSNGYSMINPSLMPGVKTGEPKNFKTFDSLKRAVFDQIKRLIDVAAMMTNREIPVRAIEWPQLYKSILTEGCMESGRSISNGGAKYDYYQMMLLGIPNLADSLAAIRKLVYGERKYTLEQLIWHLKNNYPDETVRLDFLNKVPKFGNGNPEVDLLAAEIMDFCCDYIETKKSALGQGFHPQPFTFLWMLDHGVQTAATPDGRRKGETLAYSISPMQGRDENGITSLFNSLSSLPTKKAPGTTSAIVEVDPYLFIDRNLDMLLDMFLVASKKGLCNVQFNTIDRDTLIDAQLHPESHKNLAVRVSGFSERFILLNKELQDHIISRTKHKVV